MTSTHLKNLIAVGIDGSDGAVAALRYAAETARTKGWDLQIISGYQVPSLFPDLIGRFERSAQDAHAVVDNALDRIEIDDEVVITRMVENRPASVLLRHVRTGVEAIVLGRHHLDLFDGLPGTRLSSSVAQGSACPVIVVPEHWSLPSPTDLPVIVAVDGHHDAHTALSCAADEARARETSLVVLHVVPPQGESSFPSEENAAIAELTAGVKQDNPDKPLSVRVVTGDVVDTIVEASKPASLLVVGRPERSGWRSWRMSVARAVLDSSLCPVMIVAVDFPKDHRQSAPGHG